MIKPLIPIESVGLDVIKKHVLAKRPLLNYELELVRRVTCKDERLPDVAPARRFFLTDFSEPFLRYIAEKICKVDSHREIQGEYCEFISKKDSSTGTPYYRLKLFQGKDHSSLQTYVSTITTRYFWHEMKKSARMCEEYIEDLWYPMLIQRNDGPAFDERCYRELDKAMLQLPKREQLILRLMVMNGASGLEAFDELEPYLASTTKTPTDTWSTKQKQDAMSLLKARALSHLKKLMNL